MSQQSEPPKSFLFFIGCSLGLLGSFFKKDLSLFDQIVQSLFFGSFLGIILLFLSLREIGWIIMLSPFSFLMSEGNEEVKKQFLFLLSWILLFSLTLFVSIISPNAIIGIVGSGLMFHFGCHHVVEWPGGRS
ncbi:hypothetical protein IQ226_20695 [Dolichospermum sp. LEGE 00240]|uniref:hypothetical protein n=1 Tax=Dolichospermum sp. LEGE 00240 TaxID=1828603 RepID=UPI00187E8909|nr:hypothetical protein [Dolichospermum sp. LEGE 00240]MBE9251501.1 hypothetical protein [Dolichospermum sp. LEGE 00240]